MKSCRFEMQVNVSGKRCRQNERLLTFGVRLTKMCIFRVIYRWLDHISDCKISKPHSINHDFVPLRNCCVPTCCVFLLMGLSVNGPLYKCVFTEMLKKVIHIFRNRSSIVSFPIYTLVPVFIFKWSSIECTIYIKIIIFCGCHTIHIWLRWRLFTLLRWMNHLTSSLSSERSKKS